MISALEILVLACLLAGCGLAWHAMHRRAGRSEDLAAQRGELADELILNAEAERRRLAGAIHDGPVQHLMLARALLADAGAGVTPRGVEAAEAAIGEALAELRGSMQGLHSHVLEFAGLEVALRSEAARAAPPGIPCEIEVDPTAVGFRDHLLFAVARELLLNAARHAHGTRVSIGIARRGSTLELRVRDDGCGFDDARRVASVRAGHIGLASSAHRVEAAGGRFDVRSGAAGTEVLVSDEPRPVARVAVRDKPDHGPHRAERATRTAAAAGRDPDHLRSMSVDWGDWRPFESAVGRPLAEVERSVAERYFQALMDARGQRRAQLTALLARNGVEVDIEDAGLQRLNDWYRANVRGGDGRLEDRWYAVGLDIGLFLGDAIIDRAPTVEWRLFTDGRRDVSYQRPVLMGFTKVENRKYNVDPERLVGIHGHRIVAGEDAPSDLFVALVRTAAERG